MKRVLLASCGVILAVCSIVFLGLLFSHSTRLLGVVGLGVVVLLSIVWMRVSRRSRVTNPPDAQPDPTLSQELDAATSVRNTPTWRDDVDGRVGPKW